VSGAKTVCRKHGVAHEVAAGCPDCCETPSAEPDTERTTLPDLDE